MWNLFKFVFDSNTFFQLQTSEYAGEVNTVNLKAGVTFRVLAVSTEGVLAETRSRTTENGREKLFFPFAT